MTFPLYEPLDPLRGEIRLLKVEPADGADVENTLPVRCKLITDSLTEPKHAYHAVSYVWGDPADTEAIYINNHERQATRNLVAFLRWHRTTLAAGSRVPWPPRLIWVDALCIDQSNTPERNSQVQMMAAIYNLAEMTLSWLGLGADDSDYAMRGMQRMSRCIYEHQKTLPLDADDPTGWIRGEEARNWFQPDPNSCEDGAPRGATQNRFWRAAKELLSRPYWDRAWVVQEIVLSRRVLVVCGTACLPIDSIWLISTWLRKVEGRPRPSLVDEMVWRQLSGSGGRAHLGWTSVLQLLEIRDASRQWLSSDTLRRLETQDTSCHPHAARQDDIDGGRSTWRDLVMRTVRKKATDPRDKVYSVLGLMALRLSPDYSLSVEHVYWDFAVKGLQTDRCLYLTLPLAGHGLSSAGYGMESSSPPPYALFVPSWVPNWDMLSKERVFLLFSQRLERGNAEQSQTFDRRELVARVDDRTLIVGGLRCDRVAVKRMVADETGHRWASFCESVISRLGESYMPLGVPILQAMTRLFFLDRKLNAQELLGKRPDPGLMARLGFYAILCLATLTRPPEGTLERFGATNAKAMLEKLVGKDSAEATPDGHGLFKQARTHLPGLASWPAHRFYDELTELNTFTAFWREGWPAELVQGRRERLFSTKAAFVTEKGFVGWGPAGLEDGDLICIVAGNLPVVLRKVGSHYLHIGTCFVLGLEDEDGLELATNGCEVETFRIV